MLCLIIGDCDVVDMVDNDVDITITTVAFMSMAYALVTILRY
jgi:hypothetical protein